MMTMRGMPQIYSGEEIAMRGGEVPDNRRGFPGGLVAVQPGEQSAFLAGSRTPEQAEMHDWVKGLLDVRGAHPDLQTGEEQMLQAGSNMVMYVRGRNLQSGSSTGAKDDRILVLMNKGRRPETHELPISNAAIA